VSSAPCDTGLGCTGDLTDSASRCRTLVADGGACDPMQATNVCTGPSTCVTAGATSTCVRSFSVAPIASPTFIDACATGTSLEAMLTGTDDGHAPAQTLPFGFSFFGTTYTQLWPDTNGYAVFGATAPHDFSRETVPFTGEGPLAAPWWDDLKLSAANSNLCVLTVGTAPSRSYVVEWAHATRYNHMSVDLTFELVLHESDHSIDFIYGALGATDPADLPYTTGAWASVGLQSDMGAQSAVYRSLIAPMTGIHWTPM
jgi:hypothetical protein